MLVEVVTLMTSSPPLPSTSLQGYRQKDYFMATQGPLAHTVEDFWRMVWEWKSHTIVMLTEVQEREQVSQPGRGPSVYWVCKRQVANADASAVWGLGTHG